MLALASIPEAEIKQKLNATFVRYSSETGTEFFIVKHFED
jgi:hypothetical protein